MLFRPSKRLGQHFLKSKTVLSRIIEAAGLSSTDLVLEVGPGQGVLTAELAGMARRVIAVEKDERLLPLLKERLRDFGNVDFVQGDILKMADENRFLLREPYKVVANLPYYAASRIIRLFLEAGKPPQLMVVMVQREVAERICVTPPKMTLLGVAVQFYSRPEMVMAVPRGAFWPQPKVESAVLRLKIKSEKPKVNEKVFFRIVRAGFSQPRKQILNNLARKLGLEKPKTADWISRSGLDPKQRPATLSVNDWLRLAQSF